MEEKEKVYIVCFSGGKDIKLFQLLVQVYSDSGKELKLQKDASSTGLKLKNECRQDL